MCVCVFSGKMGDGVKIGVRKKRGEEVNVFFEKRNPVGFFFVVTVCFFAVRKKEERRSVRLICASQDGH